MQHKKYASCPYKDILSAITCRSLIDIYFDDVKTIMSHMVKPHIGCGTGSGENRIQEAVSKAMASPLLKGGLINKAKAIFFIIIGSDIGVYDVSEARSLISEKASADALILIGAVLDESLDKEVRVTIIAGMGI